MKKPNSNIEIILTFIKLVWLSLYAVIFYNGLRIFWLQEYKSASNSFIELFENWLPSGNVYISHLSFGSSFAVISVFYFSFHILIRYFNKTKSKHSVLYFVPLYLVVIAQILSGLASYDNFFDTLISLNSLNKIHLTLAWVTPILFLIYLILYIVNRKRTYEYNLFSKTERMLIIVISIIVALPVLYLVRYKQFLPTEIICTEQNRYVNIDGKESDLEWLGVTETIIDLNQGANFNQGMTKIKIKTFNNRN